MRARQVFFNKGFHPNTSGQIDPSALGILLASRIPNSILQNVYIYKSLPSVLDNKNFAPTRKQISVWEAKPMVEVKTLPLKYPKIHEVRAGQTKPREKGIDVLLAIDFATKAFKNEFDIGIIFSVDSDLKPALFFVEDPAIKSVAQVAAWRKLGSDLNLARTRLSIGGNRPFCHWLDFNDFQKVRDDTKYSR